MCLAPTCLHTPVPPALMGLHPAAALRSPPGPRANVPCTSPHAVRGSWSARTGPHLSTGCLKGPPSAQHSPPLPADPNRPDVRRALWLLCGRWLPAAPPPGLSWRDRPGRPPSGRPPIVLQRPSASLALLVPCVLPEWPSIQGNAGHTQWPPLGSSAPACPWPRPHAPPPAQPRRPSTRARLLILRQAGTQMLRRRLRPLPGPSAQLPRPGPPPAEGPSLPPVVPWLSASTPWLSSRSGCCNGCVAPGPRASACPAPMALAPRPPCPDRLPKARRDRPCSINQSRAG